MKLHSLKIIGFKRIESAENTRAWLIRVSSSSLHWACDGVYAHDWADAIDIAALGMIDADRVGIKTCPPYLASY